MSLVISDLSFSYCTRNVLSHLSFTAKPGELLAVLGPNGVGKSTLFRCILGLQKGYTGSILLDGAEAGTLPAKELARRAAYIPQSRAQAFGFSVLDMALMGASHSLSLFSMPKQAELDRARAALERVGAAHLAEKNYSHLSGGEQQLVMIARALAQDSRLLLMDEPTVSLDYGNQALALSLARSLAEEGYTVLLSTHDPQQALWYADTALLLVDGRVEAFGKPDEVITAERLKALYGVDTSFVDDQGTRVIIPVRGSRHV